MTYTTFDLIAAVLSVPGLGQKSLEVLLPPTTVGPHLVELDSLDLKIQQLANENNRIKYRGISMLQAGLDNAARSRQNHQREGIHCVDWFSPDYPARFLESKAPPPLLYAKGDLAIVNAEITIALIGTRQPEGFVERSINKIAKRLADDGIVTISGLALGCDASAHQGALDSGGKTIAILPSGLGNIYPRQHQKLAEDIVDSGGLLLSEYPDRTRAQEYTFVARDRLQALLADGVICGQARGGSGSMHACNYAVELIKPLAVLPAMNEVGFEGSLALVDAGKAVTLFKRSDFMTFIADVRDSEPVWQRS